jgi:cold shock CspA family protein
MKGTVRWYNNLQGFGFILGEDGMDVIVRRTNLLKGISLYGGENVEYRKKNTYNGPQANDVKKV